MPLTQTCTISGSKFTVSDEELLFFERMEVPVPDISPLERVRRRMSWATLRRLYRRKCDGTGRSILSMYAPDAKHPVYHSDYWWSDKWDALSYGRDFDFNRPFFEQFDELLRVVPALHQSVIHSENCEFINMAGHCKNCYLSFFLDYCEDCYYIQDGNGCRNCVDSLGISNCELCYQCVDCRDCYSLLYSRRCVGCRDSLFLTDCRGCSSCIGCFNLLNKQYYVFNEKVTPEQFREIEKKFRSFSETQAMFTRMASESVEYPKKYFFGHSNEDFSGDNIRNIARSYECFNCHELENVKFSDYFFATSNSMDVSLYGNKSEWLYNCLKTGDQCSNNICCLCCWTGSNNNAYCHLVISTKDCFGCSGLYQKQYCILNKAYTRHEYETLRDRIVNHMKDTGEWGQFFPIEMSPFAYNESIANDYFPLSKEQATKRGYRWKEDSKDATVASTAATVNARQLPDSIDEVSDDILTAVIGCDECNKPFKILKPELQFYRLAGVPLPRVCPEDRHAHRFASRNPRRLWLRSCGSCGTELESTYAPERKEQVLCEPCFNEALG